MALLSIKVISSSSMPVPDVLVRAELVDSRGEPVQGFDGDNVFIGPAVQGTSPTGTVSLELVPNEDITPTGSFYAIHVGPAKVLITKSPDSQTLLEATVT